MLALALHGLIGHSPPAATSFYEKQTHTWRAFIWLDSLQLAFLSVQLLGFCHEADFRTEAQIHRPPTAMLGSRQREAGALISC